MPFNAVLFDLDGTLTDSGEGIVKCLQHVLTAFGKQRDTEQLLPYIGPPIQEGLHALLGLEGEELERGIRIFRERYERKGYLENRLYDGVPQMLEALRGAGFFLGVATSKPQYMAEIVLRHFGIRSFFQVVCGSSENGSLRHKPDIIRRVLSVSSLLPTSTIMVGDRRYDLEGAAACGLPAIGVTYGFGSAEELSAHSPLYLAGSPRSVADFLLAGNDASPALLK